LMFPIPAVQEPDFIQIILSPAAERRTGVMRE